MEDLGTESSDRSDERTASTGLPGEVESERDGVSNPTELQYHLFVERVRDYAIFLMNADGVITHWGEGATRMKEFTPDQVLGKHLSALYSPGGAEDGTPEQHIAIAKRDGEYVGEGMRLAGRRGLFPARVTLTALRRDGRLIGFSKVTQDMTEWRRTEERLQAAQQAAEAASVEKSRFLATMSHEIRTPINAVLGYADLLDLEVAGPLTEGQRAYLERIRASGGHLLDLLEDVLDFARVEAGRLAVHAREGRVSQVAEAAAALVRPQAEAAGLSLQIECECDGDDAYWGDERRVSQILVNLLGNAVKFTPAGGTVRLTCGPAQPDPETRMAGEGPWTCIRVEDTGIGIPADRQASVFEPFVQVDDQLTRVHPGTGLGLAISRRLARLMGGDLTVRSVAGQGSVFSLWLPAWQPDGGVAEETGRVPGASLTRVGHHLGGSAHQIVRSFTERLRVDPATPQARSRTRSELEDHMATLLTDLGQALVLVEEDGPDAPDTARDGGDVQRLLAERHGRQRRRLGWTEEGLRRDYAIVGEEVESVLHAAREVAGEDAVREALPIVQRLLAGALEVSLAAFHASP